ncbi:MAG: DUF2399 domain-containing protein [Desulfitobacteriaceae bacterium]
MIDIYLSRFLKNGEVVVSDENMGETLYERVVHFYQKTVHYKTKIFAYSLNTLDTPQELKDKSRWSKKKSVSQLKEWSNSVLNGLAFTHVIQVWIEHGVVIQLSEFADRGITLKGTYYIPGLNLIRFWENQTRLSEEEDYEIIKQFTEKAVELKNPYNHPGFEPLRHWLLEQLKEGQLTNKRKDFFLSVLITASKSPFFDWKEIGTNSLFKENAHAPSKIFDSNMDVLLEELENIIGDYTISIHLTTWPGNRDIILAAQSCLNFSFGKFDYGFTPVLSKITDEEIHYLQHIDSKNIKVVFAAENRAVVRKLIKHMSPENRLHIAIVGFDGQVRSAVYDLLRHFKNAGVERIIIWSDYDSAAIAMVEKLFTLGFKEFELIITDQGTLFKVPYEKGINQLNILKGTPFLTEQEDFLWDIERVKEILLEEKTVD